MPSKVALITGAGRGIGAATAAKLATEGYDLVLNYRTNTAAAEIVKQQVQGLGAKAITIKADISREAEVLHLFNEVDKAFSRLDGLVNNAGILFTQANVVDLTAERINTVFATNVTGTLLCCREAIKRMSNNSGGRGGAIVNVSSAAARLGAAGEYVEYAASKGAVDTLTIGLAKEVADQGIRVNAVRPGYIYTEMHADGGEPDRVNRLKTDLPMKRGGDPKEVANAIAWLLSAESSYTTGSFIDVAGGR